MPPTEDELPSRWQCLDWWFAPRWRALLTWVGLATVCEGVREGYFQWIIIPIWWAFSVVDRIGWVPNLQLFYQFAKSANSLLFVSWFEPMALRLSLPRAMGWICLRIVPHSALAVINPTANFAQGACLGLFASCAEMLVLRGCRTRPWMAIVSYSLWIGYLMVREDVRNSFPRFNLDWPLYAVDALPLAVPLLYGTRLLTPEERAERQS